MCCDSDYYTAVTTSGQTLIYFSCALNYSNGMLILEWTHELVGKLSSATTAGTYQY